MKAPRFGAAAFPLVGAAVVAAVLLLTAGILRRNVQSASELVVRGLGEAHVSAARMALRQAGPGNEAAGLLALVEERTEAGLRGATLVGEDGDLLHAAGASERLPIPAVDEVLWRGERARIAAPVPTRVRGEGRPDGDRRRRAWRLLVLDFEPTAALALKARARTLLVVSLGSAVGILLLAAALSRMLAQRERLQAELARGRQLAALGEMSAVLAHELRNPLASLKGHAQLLAESVEEEPRLSAKVDRIVTEAVRMERRMDDLLAFAKSGALQKLPLEPDEVLRRAVESVGSARVDALYLGQSRPASLDAHRLGQALENVLRNALQASEPDGRVEASVAHRGDRVTFTVRDRGPGLPPEVKERIFEPFVTTRTRGVGLGLAVAKRAVELHGGTLSARNHPEGGAVFELSVPLK